jgi:dTDP-4-dehydrorhamnose reductase
MRILILGAGGMIGNAMFRILHADPNLEVVGTIRKSQDKLCFDAKQAKHLIVIQDVENHDLLTRAFIDFNPQIVINCIGLTKHHSEANDPLLTIPINSFK